MTPNLWFCTDSPYKCEVAFLPMHRSSFLKKSQLFFRSKFLNLVFFKNPGKRCSFFTKIEKLQQWRCAKKFSKNSHWCTLRIHTSTWNQVYLVPVPWGSPCTGVSRRRVTRSSGRERSLLVRWLPGFQGRNQGSRIFKCTGWHWSRTDHLHSVLYMCDIETAVFVGRSFWFVQGASSEVGLLISEFEGKHKKLA